MTEHYDHSEVFEDYKRVIPELTFSKEEEDKVKYEQAEVRLESTQRAQEYIKQKETEVNELTVQTGENGGNEAGSTRDERETRSSIVIVDKGVHGR